MSIASRIARSKLDPMGGWEDQIKAKITLDAAAATTAAESATAERSNLHTSMLERMKIHGVALNKSIEASGVNPSPESQSVWRETLANLQRSEQELLAFHGIDSKAIATLDQAVFRTVDEIAKEAKEQGVPFSEKGLWSKTWIEFFQKKFPNLDPESVEALWRGRVLMMKYADATSQDGVASAAEAGDELIERATPAGYLTEFYGGGADLGAELLKEGGEFLEGLWKWDWSGSTPFDPGRTSRDFWQEKAGVELLPQDRRSKREQARAGYPDLPLIKPSSQRTEMGILSGVGGMINLGKDLLASELEQATPLADVVPPTTGTFLGADTTSQLQALDQEATSPLTDAAEAFLIKFESYSIQYGSERAMQLLSREWLNLKLRDKRSIQKHYENQ